MAEVSSTGAGGAVLVAKVANRVALIMLADRASLRNHPALMNVGVDIVGAPTAQSAILGLDGVDSFASRTEVQAISDTAVSSANYEITPGRLGLSRSVSDYLRMIDPTGSFDEVRLAQSAVGEYNMTFTEEVAKIGDGFTQVGSTGLEYTHDRFLAAQFAMQAAGVAGSLLKVMSDESFAEWQADLETRSGVTQWRSATEAMQMFRGRGYQGNYNGIDVFRSSKVQGVNTDADHGNFIFGYGAITFKELAPAKPTADTSVLLNAGPLLVESARDGEKATSRIIANAWAGFGIGETARGRTCLGRKAA